MLNNEELKQEMRIGGISLYLRIDDLQEKAKQKLRENRLLFAKEFLLALNKAFKDLGLHARFSDYTEDLTVGMPASFIRKEEKNETSDEKTTN